MATIRQQLVKLEAEAELVDVIRSNGKSEGGKLTDFGKDFVHICIEHGIPNRDIAKILEVTPGAISQWATKLKLASKKEKS